MSPYRASGQHQLQRQSASPSSASSAGAAAPAPATLAPHTNGRAIHLNRQRQRQRHQRVVFGSRIAKTHPAILANIPLENHQPEVGDAAADNRLSARAPVRSAPGRRLYDCADNRTTLNPIVGGGSCFVRRGMFPNDGSARPLQHRPIAPRARAHPHADYSAALTYRGKLMKTTTDNIIRRYDSDGHAGGLTLAPGPAAELVDSSNLLDRLGYLLDKCDADSSDKLQLLYLLFDNDLCDDVIDAGNSRLIATYSSKDLRFFLESLYQNVINSPRNHYDSGRVDVNDNNKITRLRLLSLIDSLLLLLTEEYSTSPASCCQCPSRERVAVAQVDDGDNNNITRLLAQPATVPSRARSSGDHLQQRRPNTCCTCSSIASCTRGSLLSGANSSDAQPLQHSDCEACDSSSTLTMGFSYQVDQTAASGAAAVTVGTMTTAATTTTTTPSSSGVSSSSALAAPHRLSSVRNLSRQLFMSKSQMSLGVPMDNDDNYEPQPGAHTFLAAQRRRLPAAAAELRRGNEQNANYRHDSASPLALPSRVLCQNRESIEDWDNFEEIAASRQNRSPVKCLQGPIKGVAYDDVADVDGYILSLIENNNINGFSDIALLSRDNCYETNPMSIRMRPDQINQQESTTTTTPLPPNWNLSLPQLQLQQQQQLDRAQSANDIFLTSFDRANNINDNNNNNDNNNSNDLFLFPSHSCRRRAHRPPPLSLQLSPVLRPYEDQVSNDQDTFSGQARNEDQVDTINLMMRRPLSATRLFSSSRSACAESSTGASASPHQRQRYCASPMANNDDRDQCCWARTTTSNSNNVPLTASSQRQFSLENLPYLSTPPSQTHLMAAPASTRNRSTDVDCWPSPSSTTNLQQQSPPSQCHSPCATSPVARRHYVVDCLQLQPGRPQQRAAPDTCSECDCVCKTTGELDCCRPASWRPVGSTGPPRGPLTSACDGTGNYSPAVLAAGRLVVNPPPLQRHHRHGSSQRRPNDSGGARGARRTTATSNWSLPASPLRTPLDANPLRTHDNGSNGRFCCQQPTSSQDLFWPSTSHQSHYNKPLLPPQPHQVDNMNGKMRRQDDGTTCAATICQQQQHQQHHYEYATGDENQQHHICRSNNNNNNLMDTRATDYDNVADNVVCCGGGGGGDEQHDGQLNEDDDGEGSSSGFAESISLVPKQAEGHLSVSVAEQMSKQASNFVLKTSQQQHKHSNKQHLSNNGKRNKNHRQQNLQVRRTLRVKIKKSKPILGIAIEGGYNVSGQSLPRIVCVHEDGAAYQCGKLRASDLILEVNGVSTVNMTHDQIAKTIANAYYQSTQSYIEFLIGESVPI